MSCCNLPSVTQSLFCVNLPLLCSPNKWQHVVTCHFMAYKVFSAVIIQIGDYFWHILVCFVVEPITTIRVTGITFEMEKNKDFPAWFCRLIHGQYYSLTLRNFGFDLWKCPLGRSSGITRHVKMITPKTIELAQWSLECCSWLLLAWKSDQCIIPKKHQIINKNFHLNLLRLVF